MWWRKRAEKPKPPPRSIGFRLRCVWQNLSDGLTLHQIWSSFRRETRASYRLYSAEMDGRFEGVPHHERWLGVTRALFWALLRKLSPPRRIALFAAIIIGAAGLAFDRLEGAAFAALVLFGILGLELADRVAMKRDLEIARDIQSRLVPQVAPLVPGVDLAFGTQPANTIAGDYYDAFLTARSNGEPGERLLLVVADVAGKSVPAALLMATFQSSLHTLLQEALPLPRLIERLNQYCCNHSLEGLRFTTAVLGELDCARGTLSYVNAGHNAPALRRRSGLVERLQTGGMPLGIQADACYAAGNLTMQPGDRLVVFTDGVVEALNAAGEEYGDGRLEALLREPPPAAAAETLERLFTSVDRFSGEAVRSDDVTALVLSYLGDEPA